MSATSPLSLRAGRGAPPVGGGQATALAHTLPAPRTVPGQGRRLEVLPGGGQSAARAPFVLMVVAVLAAGLLGLLRLNIALAADALTLGELKHTNTVVTDQVQALDQQLDAEASPARLAARASSLGMVPNPNPAFIRLSDGRVLGSPTPGPTPVPSAVPAGTTASGPSSTSSSAAHSSTSSSAQASPKASGSAASATRAAAQHR